MSRRRMMNKLPDKEETISLFHCDDNYGTDSKGFATPSSRSLGAVYGRYSLGNSGYIQYKDNQWDEILLGGPWTVDYWIYPRSCSTWACDVFLGGNSSYDAIIRCQTNYSVSSISFFISGGRGWVINDYKASVIDGSWNHVAITYDTNICKIYIDGILKKSFNLTITNICGPLNFFGRGPSSPENNDAKSNSYRDEIRISRGVRWMSNFKPPIGPYVD